MYAFAFLFSSPDNTKLAITQEVKRNCSISENIEVIASKGYQTHYERSVLEDCHLCGSLVKYLWPDVKTTGTHVIGHAKEGTWQYKLGKFYKIAALYHEMGHIHHKDSLKGERNLKKNHVSLYTLNNLKKHDEDEFKRYTALLEETEFAQDLARIAGYVEKARTFFKSYGAKTIVGTYVARFLAQGKPLWNSPSCPVCLQEKRYKRGKESRADLFAADKMWLNGQIDVIVAILYLHAASSRRTAGPYDIHPSGIERALMFIGFLLGRALTLTLLLEILKKIRWKKSMKMREIYLGPSTR